MQRSLAISVSIGSTEADFRCAICASSDVVELEDTESRDGAPVEVEQARPSAEVEQDGQPAVSIESLQFRCDSCAENIQLPMNRVNRDKLQARCPKCLTNQSVAEVLLGRTRRREEAVASEPRTEPSETRTEVMMRSGTFMVVIGLVLSTLFVESEFGIFMVLLWIPLGVFVIIVGMFVAANNLGRNIRLRGFPLYANALIIIGSALACWGVAALRIGSQSFWILIYFVVAAWIGPTLFVMGIFGYLAVYIRRRKRV